MNNSVTLMGFLEDWSLTDRFEYETSLHARFGLLKGLENRSISIYNWNENGNTSSNEGHESYIDWLLDVAQLYINKVNATYYNKEMVEQNLWAKALNLAVKDLPKLIHFSFYPNAYIRILKFIADENIYPKFHKDPYAREVRNLLLKCNCISESSCSIDDPIQKKEKAKWKNTYYPIRLYWYAAVISSYNFDLISWNKDESLMVLLKLRIQDYLQSSEAKERNHVNVSDMIQRRHPGDPSLKYLQQLIHCMLRLGQLDELAKL